MTRCVNYTVRHVDELLGVIDHIKSVRLLQLDEVRLKQSHLQNRVKIIARKELVARMQEQLMHFNFNKRRRKSNATTKSSVSTTTATPARSPSAARGDTASREQISSADEEWLRVCGLIKRSIAVARSSSHAQQPTQRVHHAHTGTTHLKCAPSSATAPAKRFVGFFRGRRDGVSRPQRRRHSHGRHN